MDNDDQQNLNFTPPWVPMAKDAARLLPKDRPFTEVEALLSIQLDHNNHRQVSIFGYSRLWGWSTRRVRNFFHGIGACIQYPYDTQKVQRQTGEIAPFQRTDTDIENEQIKFIDFRDLQDNGNRKRTEDAPQLTRNKNKRINIGQKDPRIRVFIDWFSHKFEHRFQREYMITNWAKESAHVKKLLALGQSWTDLQYLAVEFLLDEDPFLNKAGHNIGQLLRKVGQNSYQKYLDPEFRKSNEKHIVREDGTAMYSDQELPQGEHQN